jgi:plasmid stabilization system protein ParE
MEVFLSGLAELKLDKLCLYLLEEWNLKIRNEFLLNLNKKIEQISNHPESCPQSKEFMGLYKCLVTKQTSFFYRIKWDANKIEIITIFDNRQNPKKLKKSLR